MDETQLKRLVNGLENRLTAKIDKLEDKLDEMEEKINAHTQAILEVTKRLGRVKRWKT